MATRRAAAADTETIARIYNEGIEEEGEVVAWAVAHRYRDRAAYDGVGDFSVYVDRSARGRGHGRLAVQALIDECERRGMWKLLSRIFPENEASLALDGEWRDCVIVERLLGA